MKINGKWELAYIIALFSLIIFSLYFGTPLLGFMNFESFYSKLGCSRSFGALEPCIIFGFDYAKQSFLYNIPIMNGLFTPIAYVVGFYQLIIVWVIIILILRFKRNKEHQSINSENN